MVHQSLHLKLHDSIQQFMVFQQLQLDFLMYMVLDKPNSFFRYYFKLFKNSKEIEIWGRYANSRHLHIDDLVSGLIMLAQNGKEGEIYNLASGMPLN